MGNPFSHPQPATNHILVHDVATQNSLGYRSPDVELEDLELQLKHPDLPHWHNLHSPDKVKVYLLTTVDDHWALFIDLTNQSRFATCGEFEFSGLICNLGIESTQSRRLVLMMLTLPSNSSAIDPYLRRT